MRHVLEILVAAVAGGAFGGYFGARVSRWRERRQYEVWLAERDEDDLG